MENNEKLNKLDSYQLSQQGVKIPYDIDIEQTILGGIMVRNEEYGKILSLTPEDFYETIHQEIFKKINELYIEGSSINPVILAPYFKNNPVWEELKIPCTNYLLGLSSRYSWLENLQDYARALKKLKRARVFQEFVYNNREVDISTNIDEKLSELGDILFEPSKKIKLRKESDVAAEIAKGLDVKLPCYSTGYNQLDTALGGGLYEGKSYGWVAREKTGKTAGLGSISHNLSKAGVNHLYVAIEMGSEEIHKRLMAYDIGYNPIYFYDEKTRNQPHFQTQICKLALQERSSKIYADAPGINFEELKRLILSTVRKHNLKGVIIDYLQIITGEKKGENKSEFYGRVAQWIADTGREENIFTLTAAQENAQGDARGSMGFQAAMDLTIFMKRPDDENDLDRWFEIRNSRYTVSCRIGSEIKPSFEIGGKGVFLMQKDDLAVYDNQAALALDEVEQGSWGDDAHFQF